MVEEITDKFGKAMKKGFISTLVLLILESEPSHGYQIIKAIEEQTHGFWTPTASTMYTVLKELREKELIEQISPLDDDDSKKVYQITTKGENALKILMKTEKEMRISMRSIISSTLGLQNDILGEDEKEFQFMGPFTQRRLKGKSAEDKLTILKEDKSLFKKMMAIAKQKLQNIEEQIKELENSEN
jgi:DNA-binding PadR family transcriptional regulator